jgi:glycosyltransferase involved in cell wall biosynthesis
MAGDSAGSIGPLEAERTLKAISIACCTRDRPSELCRLIDSVLHACAQLSGLDFELLVVDDGALPSGLLRSLAERAHGAGIRWIYHNKRQRQGLLRSRIEAVALATHDWILFFDDDVEVEPTYLSRLFDTIEHNPGLAGLGGVDVLAPSPPAWKVFGEIAVGLEPLRVGHLSRGGFPAEMGRARMALQPFASRRVYGCNMAFWKTALRGLRMLHGFEGYSLYEDAYLSFEACRTGLLLVDPSLKVRHHRAPSSRDSSYAVGRMSILNHYQLLRLYGANEWRHIGVGLSVLCWIAWSIAKSFRRSLRVNDTNFDFVRGQFSALKTLLTGRSLFRFQRHPEAGNQ